MLCGWQWSGAAAALGYLEIHHIPPDEYFVMNNEFSLLKQSAGFKECLGQLTRTAVRQTNLIFLSFPGLHEEFPFKGSQANAHWREAVQLLLAWVRLEVCQVGRAHKTSEETHGKQTFQMSPLWSHFCKERPPQSSHEEALKPHPQSSFKLPQRRSSTFYVIQVHVFDMCDIFILFYCAIPQNYF